MENPSANLHFFRCSVSEDLYGASADPTGHPLPTPGGGIWIPVTNLEDLGSAAGGFDAEAAAKEIATWGCHWFTSNGPRDIYWGPDGPPKDILSRTEQSAVT